MLLTTCANQERFVWKVTSLYSKPCRINQEKQNIYNNTSYMLSVTVTKRGCPGIEPGTSRTQSENHTSRPTSLSQ